jgi:hypothetical protein
VAVRAHTLALAANQDRALFLDLPDVERRLSLSVLLGKGDVREDFVAQPLDETGAEIYVATAV